MKLRQLLIVFSNYQFIQILFFGVHQITHMTALYKLLFVLLLIVTVSPYAIDGTWTLRTSEIPQLKKITAGILFTFEDTLDQNGQIQNTLTIYSCRKLIFSYNIQNDQIFFKHVQTGSSLRPCVANEIVFIRSQIDIIFNFYIMGTIMLMLPPNGDSPIKFDRYITSGVPQINGVWNIEDSVFYSRISDTSVTINGSHIAFCGGISVFSYRLSGNNRIDINNVSNVSSCNSAVTNKLLNASLYRVKQTDEFYIYDSAVDLIMHLNKRSNFPVIRVIGVTQTNSLINNKSNNLTQNTTTNSNNSTNRTSNLSNRNNQTNNISNSNHSLNPTSATGTHNNNKNNTASNASKPITSTTSNRSSTNTNSSVSTSNSTQPTPTRTNSTNSTNSSNSSSTASTSIKTNSNSSSSNSSVNAVINKTSNVSAATSQKMVAVQNANQVYGIWYPFNISQIAELASYPATALSKYQIIINPARILISGGCNTIFSTYTFSQNKFSNFSQISTQNKCPNNYDTVISNIVFGNNQFYTIGSSPPLVAIKSAADKLLMLLSQTAPS